MTGIEKITGRIAADAEAETRAELTAAQAQADEITARYADEARRVYETQLARGTAAARDREEHLTSGAQLEARKMLLAAKQDMLDSAFDEALRQLLSLKGTELTELLARLAVRASNTGREEIILSARDQAIGPAVAARANALGGCGLTFRDTPGGFEGGLLLNDGDVEVNCTFETLVRLTRGEIAGEVAGVLFG